MNSSGRPDMIRSGIVQTPNMLALGNPPFMQNSAHLGQPQLGQTPMGMPQNVNAANSTMPMLSGGPVPPPNQRYNLQPNPMQQQQQQQQQQMQMQQRMIVRQGPNPQQPNPATGAPSGALMPTQLQGMPFPGTMMQQPSGPNNAVRRVGSQSHLNSLTGMPSSVASSMTMGMNPQASMPAHLRQVSQQHQQHLRMQQQLQAGMSSDIGMGMNRQGPNPPLPQNMVVRSNSAQAQQVMSSLAQPPSIGPVQHSGGMPSHHQNTFSNGGPMTPQHQPPQLSSSPRPGPISQTHTPNMSMTTPGPSHTPISRSQMTPDNSSSMFIYPHAPVNSQFPGNNPPRIPPNSNPGSYSFVTPSTPPMQMDISQPSPPNLIHTQGGVPNRSAFLSTPAQQYEMMNHSGIDLYGSSFGMPPPSAPPRPPSHNNPHQPPNQQQHPMPQTPQQQTQPLQSHQQQQPHHQSPSQPEQMNIHPQRPQSQPQMPGRPPSQAGPTQTPRSLQLPVNPISMSLPGGLTATGRIPLAQQGQQQLMSGQHLPIAPRPPSISMAAGPLPTMPSVPVTSSAHVPTDTPPAATSLIPRPIPSSSLLNLGSGQGLIRLLQFSGVLAVESKTKLQLSWWNDLIKEYFTPKAVMKLTLWKDNQRNEAKPFEIGVPILPRFFLVTTQSGVKSMTLSLDGARERIFGPGHSVVECVAAIWTYKYTNGYTVTLRGPLTTHVIITTTHPPGNTQIPQYTLRFEDFQFDANFHEKYIALESIMDSRMLEASKTPRVRNAPTPTPPGTSTQVQQQLQQVEDDKKWEEPRVIIERGSIPGEPVNAFGIPQATMRCLELAESVVAMAEIIVFSKDTELGPFDALKEFANKIRSTQGVTSTPSNLPSNGIMTNNNTSLSNTFQTFSSSSGLFTPTAPVTLYSSAPASVTNPPPSTNPSSSSSISSPQNNASSSATNSPQKQPKTIPSQQQQAQTPSQASGPASSPAVSSGATTNTPAMSNTSLKRKQASDTTSPAVGNPDQAPLKRVPRKRVRAGTGAGS